MTLRGGYTSISYCPADGRLISGSHDKTARQWDLNAAIKIEEVRRVYKKVVCVVAVSSNSQWVVTGGGDDDCAELKAWEVETGKYCQNISRPLEGDQLH